MGGVLTMWAPSSPAHRNRTYNAITKYKRTYGDLIETQRHQEREYKIGDGGRETEEGGQETKYGGLETDTSVGAWNWLSALDDYIGLSSALPHNLFSQVISVTVKLINCGYLLS